MYKKKKYASYTNKSDVQDNPTVKGHEHVSTEDQNTSGPSTSKGHNDPTEGHNYGQLEGQGRQGQRTVARVAPFSVAAEGGGGQEESIVHVVEDEIDTLPTAVAATAVDPYEQIECDLQVVTYIQVIQCLKFEITLNILSSSGLSYLKWTMHEREQMILSTFQQ